jgi:hypothetical protein
LFDAELLDRLSTWGQALRHLAAGHRGDSVQMVRCDAAAGLAADHVDGQKQPGGPAAILCRLAETGE